MVSIVELAEWSYLLPIPAPGGDLFTLTVEVEVGEMSIRD
jgi:hypothetical protein